MSGRGPGSRFLRRRHSDGSGDTGGTGDDRALSAVVGKTLEAGIVVLYVSMMIAVLYGGVGPEYERTAGAELGERVLAEGAFEVQSAVPASPNATTTVRHDVPRSLDNDPYRIVARNGSLALVHEDSGIGGEIPLALPPDVVRVEGAWESTAPAIVSVERTPAGRVVHLGAGSS